MSPIMVSKQAISVKSSTRVARAHAQCAPSHGRECELKTPRWFPIRTLHVFGADFGPIWGPIWGEFWGPFLSAND